MIATSTDYDSWREHEGSVTVEDVFKVLQANAHTSRVVAETILEELQTAVVEGDILTEEVGCMRMAIMPRSDRQSEADRQKLRYILPEYFS